MAEKPTLIMRVAELLWRSDRNSHLFHADDGTVARTFETLKQDDRESFVNRAKQIVRMISDELSAE